MLHEILLNFVRNPHPNVTFFVRVLLFVGSFWRQSQNFNTWQTHRLQYFKRTLGKFWTENAVKKGNRYLNISLIHCFYLEVKVGLFLVHKIYCCYLQTLGLQYFKRTLGKFWTENAVRSPFKKKGHRYLNICWLFLVHENIYCC